MQQSYILSFAEGVTVNAPSEDRIEIVMPVTYKQLTLSRLSSGLRQIIDILASTGATEEALAEIVTEKDGTDALAKLYYHLMTFAKHRIISYSIIFNGKRLATLAPNSALFSFSHASINPQSNYVLSRFAYIHMEHGEMVMESPLSHGKLSLYGQEAAVMTAELARAQTLAALCDALPHLSPDTVLLFLKMLVGAGFACEVKDGKAYPEESAALMQWDFHDLLFHARSRLGRHANPYGGTYRFHSKIEPLPVIKPAIMEDAIPLYRPDYGCAQPEGSSFYPCSGRKKIYPGICQGTDYRTSARGVPLSYGKGKTSAVLRISGFKQAALSRQRRYLRAGALPDRAGVPGDIFWFLSLLPGTTRPRKNQRTDRSGDVTAGRRQKFDRNGRNAPDTYHYRRQIPAAFMEV